MESPKSMREFIQKSFTKIGKAPFVQTATVVAMIGLASCGGGAGGNGGGGSNGSGGSTPSVVGAILLATQNIAGTTQFSAFPYQSDGTISSGTPTSTYVIPAGNPCAGSTPFSAGYDSTNHLLFLFINPTASTTTVCSFTVTPSTGALMAAGSIPNISGNNASIDLTDKIVFISTTGSNSTPEAYSYSNNGTISSTQTTISFSPPSGDSFNNFPVDTVNRIVWYGPTNGTTINGGFIYAAGFGSSTPFSTSANSVLLNSTAQSFSDTQNGVAFQTTNVPSSCTTTATTLSLYSYSTSSGTINNATPNTGPIGTCSYTIYGNNNINTDNSEKILFSINYNNGSITLYPYSSTSSPTLGGHLSPVTVSSLQGNPLADFTNHLIFAVNYSGSTRVAAITVYPYSTGGIGTPKTLSSLSLGNYTTAPSCSGSGNCEQLTFATLN